MDLLKTMISPLSTAAEQSSVAEEARVGSSNRVDDARGASAKVIDTAPEMPAGPFTKELLPEGGIEATTPLLRTMLGFSLCTNLRGWTLLSTLRLRRAQG